MIQPGRRNHAASNVWTGLIPPEQPQIDGTAEADHRIEHEPDRRPSDQIAGDEGGSRADEDGLSALALSALTGLIFGIGFPGWTGGALPSFVTHLECSMTGERYDLPGVDAAEIAVLADIVHADGRSGLRVPAGTVVEARLKSVGTGGRNAVAVADDGTELLLPQRPSGISEGAALAVECDRNQAVSCRKLHSQDGPALQPDC